LRAEGKEESKGRGSEVRKNNREENKKIINV
jgi:hypothetical protein